MNKKIIYILSLTFSFFLGIGLMYLLIRTLPIEYETTQKVVNEYKIEEQAVTDAVEKAYDSVVVVESYLQNRKIGTGTGFVYKKDNEKGYIVTNSHVINSSDNIKVVFTNENVVDAILLGEDVFADIAVLSVDVEDILSVIEIGTSEDKELGATVLTIGAPMGSDYSGTVTKGILSGKDRLVSVAVGQSQGNDWLMRVLQTDAAINPGNSGGPLIDLSGSVIGINSLKIASSNVEGMGFAIPIEDAMRYVLELEKGEKIKRPLLGVELLDVTETYALFIMDIIINDDVENGVVVASVIKGSPADVYKLKKGDVILELNGVKTKNKAEFRYELYKNDPKDEINLKVYRDNKIVSIDVVLEDSN